MQNPKNVQGKLLISRLFHSGEKIWDQKIDKNDYKNCTFKTTHFIISSCRACFLPESWCDITTPNRLVAQPNVDWKVENREWQSNDGNEPNCRTFVGTELGEAFYIMLYLTSL